MTPTNITEAVSLARELMQDEPASFKRGYTAENAAKAVAGVFGFPEAEILAALTGPTREEARAYYEAKAAQYREAEARGDFCNYPHAMVYQHAEWCLRWLDCAPEGARFLLAPLQDKRGVPNGEARSENVGDCKTLREARAAVGRHPLTGKAVS